MNDQDRSNPKAGSKADDQAKSGRLRLLGLSPTPHDALFWDVFSDPEQAQALLRDQLPNEIAGLLADTPPRILNGTFVDERLRETQADLVLEVDLAKGGSGLAYVLVEHKSTSEIDTALQMLGYMVSIWQDLRKRGHTGKLPLIIPLLGYSGSTRWKAGTNLADMIEQPTGLVFLRGPFMIVREWAQMDGDDLSRDQVVEAGLLTLTGRGMDNLDKLDAALLKKPGLLNRFSTYIKGTAKGAALEELEQKLAAAPSDLKEGVLGSIMEKLRAEGEAKGRAEGEARGIAMGRTEGEATGQAKGQARSLIRLLERRFGALPAAVRARIAEADHDQLDAWVDRVLDAKSVEEVLA